MPIYSFQASISRDSTVPTAEAQPKILDTIWRELKPRARFAPPAQGRRSDGLCPFTAQMRWITAGLGRPRPARIRKIQ